MKRKYFFFDIDGTLTSSKVFNLGPESTKRALCALEAQGHFVAIATERAHFRAKEFAQEHGIQNMVCEGGNGLYFGGKLIAYEPLADDLAIAIMKKAEALGFPLAVSLTDDRIRLTKDERFVKQCPGAQGFVELQVEPHLDLDALHHIRRFMIAMRPDEEAKLPEIKQIGMMRYDDSFVIVEPDDKYKGILRMVTEAGGDPQDIVVFGDGLNDRKMFEQAPFSIAMGNAIPQLKMLADYVSDDSDHDGIWNACVHFNWIEPK